MSQAHYDSIAPSYAQVAAERFERIAMDLARRTLSSTRARVLDLGVGTGAGARAVLACTDGHAEVFGIDMSAGMLKLALRATRMRGVRGDVQALPFADDVFDAAISNFVLNHVRSYESVLAECRRVLVSGGRLGITAWGVRRGKPYDLWREYAEAWVGAEALAAANKNGVPWEDYFATEEHLIGALRDAGFDDTRVECVTYDFSQSLAGWMENIQLTFGGGCLKNALSAADWDRFCRMTEAAIRAQCGDPVTWQSPVLHATTTNV